MKRLLMVALAAVLTLSGSARAEGPDDQYIEIYRLVQDGDQMAANEQIQLARQRYTQAKDELLKLKTSYPNWNQKLIEYRLRILDAKLQRLPKSPSAAPVPAAPTTPVTPAPTQPQNPSPEKAPAPAPAPESAVPPVAQPQPQVQTPVPVAPVQPAPVQPAPVQPAPVQPAPAQPDERDNQVRMLQDQVGRLQSDRAVLENKLREALAAQPAAIDPRELARAQERIRAVEKEKEVLNVSLQQAESKLSKAGELGAADARKALAAANKKVAEQTDVISALREEKLVLEKKVRETIHGDEEIAQKLRAENDVLKKQLSEKPAPAEGARPGTDQQELAAAKTALQSSRELVNSLQVRNRALEDERDRLEKLRSDLEAKLAAASSAAARTKDSDQFTRLEKERDDLQKKLNDTVRQLAEAKSRKGRSAEQAAGSTEELGALRARLDVLEARKVPYTPEELALFKKPQDGAIAALPPAPAAEEKPAADVAAQTGPLLAEAQSAFETRHFDQAEKKYLEVLRLDGKNVAALQRLGAAQLEQSKPQEAEASLKKALERNPSDARSLLLVGIAEYDQEKYDAALDNLSRSAQLDPQNAETQNYIGIILSQKGQRAAAETALRKAIQLNPTYASAHHNLAVVYATQKPPFLELARWHYQKALAYGHPPSADLEKLLDSKQASTQK